MMTIRPHQGRLRYKGNILEPSIHYNIDCTVLPNHEPVLIFHRIDGEKLHDKPSVIPYSYLKRTGFQYWEPSFPKYLTTWLNVHENQYNAGRDIIEHYQSGIKDVILVAQMQSGKTGTARYVTHALLHCTDLGHEWQHITSHDIYFICGMNDNDLRNQAIREFNGLIPESNILFSKQLQTINKSEALPKAYFVIIDESHYAGNVGSQVDKFMKRIQPKIGKIYTLSVSATPMAELASSDKYGKGRVVLRPGPYYYGIKDIFATGQILQSVDVTNNQEAFCDLVAEQYELQHENLDYKYNIVRLPSQWYYRDLEDALNELELNIKYINHHTECSESICVDDFNKYVKHKPEVTTIIWIYGSLRAGKQLDTKHIGFVHDTSNSSPDTIAQSLLGRIMGYRKEGNGVTCFTDMNSAQLMLEWVNKHYDTNWIPRGSNGVLDGYNNTIVPWQLHMPIGLQLPDDAVEYYRALKMKHHNRYPYKDDITMDIVMASGDKRSLLEDIFENYGAGPSGGLTIMTEFNAENSYYDHWVHNYQCYVNGQPTRGFDVQTHGKYYHVYVNLNRCSLQYGMVLVTYKEYVNNKVPANYVRVCAKSRFN